MSRLLALDLFCGAGGASKGLAEAGFEVVGIDRRSMPRYVHAGRFIQADALHPPVDLRAFDFIWASPPCQRFSVATNLRRGQVERSRHPDLIEPVRAMLQASGVPFVIENVPAAPIRADLVLTGAGFGLPIIRRRHFECWGWCPPLALLVQHAGTVRRGDLACVAGHGANTTFAAHKHRWRDLPAELRRRLLDRNSAAGWREAMGIDWMSRNELAQAIPPAYAAFIGRAFLAQRARDRAA